MVTMWYRPGRMLDGSSSATPRSISRRSSSGKNCKNCAYKNGFTYVDRKNYEFKILRNKAANCYFTLYNSKIHDISSKVKSNSFNLYLNMLQLSRDEADNVFAAFKDKLSLTTRDKTNGHFINGVL